MLLSPSAQSQLWGGGTGQEARTPAPVSSARRPKARAASSVSAAPGPVEGGLVLPCTLLGRFAEMSEGFLRL